MKDYKDNLNLPTTDFPMRGDLAKREPAMLEQWIKDDVYSLIRKAQQGKPLFILHDGPPYANGSIHIGHVSNKVLKDIILKTKGLLGYDTPYVPGWDCHGLPIEHKVESEFGKVGEKVDAREFRRLCREYAATQVDLQRKDFIRLGVFADWHNPYLTMNFHTEAAIIEALGKIVKNGHVYKGFKPIYWCSDCGSALAEAEVEYQDKKSNSIYVAFKAKNAEQIAVKFGLDSSLDIEALIWTTTPWTIPANRAISVNPELEYQVAKVTIEKQIRYFIIAIGLVESLRKELKADNLELVGKSVKGKDLDLLDFIHPLYHHVVPILNGEHVSLDAGTGLVHTAPDHGIEDFNVCKQYNIPVADLLDKETRFKQNVKFFAGIKALDANVPVIKELFNHGALIAKSTIIHSYPHCWRHKTPLMFRATPQWFISMDNKGLRSKALAAIKETKWVPIWGEARIDNMVANRPDWCISRQRTWGVPITLFTHKLTGELHPKTEEIFALATKVVSEGGIQAWWDLQDQQIIDDYQDYDRVTDTLDVWFDSGSTSISVVDKRPEFKSHPVDVYLEGSDQHRGWFMSSLMISCAVKEKAPYKTVLTHGFVVDGQGRKMSKSIGNVISPSEVTDSLGADILRLWIAATDYSSEMSVSQEILKRSAESYRRIRNTARFLLANLNGFDPKTDMVPFDKLVEIDLWAINLAKQVQQEIINYSNDYDFHLVVHRLIKFCSIEMGSFYLDVIKDRQYTTKADSIARKSCQTAIYYIVQALVRWISPILSFTAQEIWEKLPARADKYIFTQEYFKFEDDLPKVDYQFWNSMLELRSQVNFSLEQNRKNKLIGSSLEADVTLYVDEDLQEKTIHLGNELKFLLLTSAVKVLPYHDKSDEVLDCIPNKLAVFISKHQSKKCERCWHHVETVGNDPRDPDLCDRCISNVYEDGEIRKYV